MRIKLTYKRMVQGMFLALGAPLGWFFLQPLIGNGTDQTAWLYGYMLLGSITVFAAFGWYVGYQEMRAVELGLHDPLTGLYNQGYFQERLYNSYSLTDRNPHFHLSVALLDLDHFKRVNDHYGHPAGDEVLRTVAQVLRKMARKGDIVARVGGEEFAIIMHDTCLDEALAACERIRKAIATLDIPVPDDGKINITLSAGIATTSLYSLDGESQLYQSADRCLYKAKQGGRNRVIGVSITPTADLKTATG